MKIGERVRDHRMSQTGRIKAIEATRVNVLVMETGERVWFETNDFLAIWKLDERRVA